MRLVIRTGRRRRWPTPRRSRSPETAAVGRLGNNAVGRGVTVGWGGGRDSSGRGTVGVTPGGTRQGTTARWRRRRKFLDKRGLPLITACAEAAYCGFCFRITPHPSAMDPGPCVFKITSNTLVRSSQSSSGPAGRASDGYGLGGGAAALRARTAGVRIPRQGHSELSFTSRTDSGSIRMSDHTPPPIGNGVTVTGGPESVRDR